MSVQSGWAKRKGIFVDREKWPYYKWPKYIFGAAAFMGREAAVAISRAASTSEDIIYIPIEDAVFTGVLRIKACIEIEHQPNFAVHFRGKINLLKNKIESVLQNP
ncbi:unnamed protein product [Oikopleura dioica]|uniref:Hexosyltransferase n=1 Tax=Oikopleura dioica TaxID=34765 RepID=E4WRK0_OIKDI|nr:unnamed protein product [Oikopleura dioica]